MKPAAAEVAWGGHAEHAQVRQAVDDRARDVGLAVDLGGIDVLVGELADGVDGRLGLGRTLGVELWIREEILPRNSPW